MGSQLDYSPRGTEDDVVLEPPIRLPSRLFSPGTGLKQTWLETRRFGPGDASISPPWHHVSAVYPAPCFSLPIRYECWPVLQSSRVVFRHRIRRRGQPYIAALLYEVTFSREQPFSSTVKMPSPGRRETLHTTCIASPLFSPPYSDSSAGAARSSILHCCGPMPTSLRSCILPLARHTPSCYYVLYVHDYPRMLRSRGSARQYLVVPLFTTHAIP